MVSKVVAFAQEHKTYVVAVASVTWAWLGAALGKVSVNDAVQMTEIALVGAGLHSAVVNKNRKV